MTSVWAFIVAIGVLVTIHEFGHYLAARSCGVRVLKFSIGFGQPIFKYQANPSATEWVLSWIPLGGYVKMLDSRETDAALASHSAADWSQAFDHQVIAAKMWIVFAGPLANLLLAFVCYWGLIAQGEIGLKPYIGPVEQGSLAATAKLRQGDLIVALDGKAVGTWQEAQWQLLESWMVHKPVAVVTKTPQGEVHQHVLPLNQLAGDPDGEVMQKTGLAVLMPVVPAVIGDIMADSVAEQSGLQTGDRILKVNQKPIADWQQFVKQVRASPAKALKIDYQRGEQLFQVKLVPETIQQGGQKIGRLGAAVNMEAVDLTPYQVIRHYSASQAALRALDKMQETIAFTLKMLGKMITGQASLKAISGPVSIADAAGESAGMGLKPYIGFIALLSISIAVMNLLPIPVLDGGHLLYHMAELIRGEPLPDKVLAIGQRLGLGILGALMVIAFFNDINRYLIG
ncbi:RIP metalloprotease RseP [Methylophilus sp. 5]|uniref:RIP metalloprotease RseP n=1 Tax=Methylophilus sp. 5 TaxID=1112274 RepID=UPI00048E96A2|nr:RIP metalloprotease RseP [Methylophilus sp. 5]